jgi:hypothetical protein
MYPYKTNYLRSDMNANEVREEILSWVKNAPKLNGCAVPGDGERGVVTGLMNTVLRLDDDLKIANERRRQVLAYIFRDSLNKPMTSGVSAKELTNEMWWALCKYIEPHKDDSGAWTGNNGFAEALISCWRAQDAWQRDMDRQLGFLEML